jgi:divalent metal cation (Fe/Co/Zn/Cd) transporter
MSRDETPTGQRGETRGHHTETVRDESDPSVSTARGRESVQSQLDVLTLLVAVVGVGLLLGGVAETFAAIFALGVAVLVLFRLSRREPRS